MCGKSSPSLGDRFPQGDNLPLAGEFDGNIVLSRLVVERDSGSGQSADAHDPTTRHIMFVCDREKGVEEIGVVRQRREEGIHPNGAGVVARTY